MRQLTIRAAMNLGNLGYEQGDIFGIVAKNSHHVGKRTFFSTIKSYILRRICIFHSGCRSSLRETQYALLPYHKIKNKKY